MPGYGVVQQANPYFAEPVGAFAMQQQPGYPATQQPPAMHDQIHRVGAALRGRRAAPRCPPDRPTSTPRAARARCCPARETRAGPPARGTTLRAPVRKRAARPRTYPRAGTGGGVPASYVSVGGGARRAVRSLRARFFYDGAPPVAGVIGAHAPGGMVRMERNSQGASAGAEGAAAA